MSLAKFNATLENAVNTLQFWNVDDLGEPVPFDGDTEFRVSRIDTGSVIATGSVTVLGNLVTVVLDLGEVTIGVNYDYDHAEYEHAYSLRSTNQVYLYGKLNIVRIP